MNNKIHTLYFSTTGTTEKIVTGIAEKIAESYGGKFTVNRIDFTMPEAVVCSPDAVSRGAGEQTTG